MTEIKQDLRRKYLASKSGDLTTYAGMIGEEFSSKIDRLSQIIGTSHEPSIGRYKETLLRNCIKDFIPRRYNVGTGFVLFPDESPLKKKFPNHTDIINLRSHYVSKELDIAVYDDSNYPPIFKDNEFVILRPESLRSVIEVKGFLDPNQINSALDLFIDLGVKWRKCAYYYKSWAKEKLPIPALHLLAWNVGISKDGKPKSDGKKLRNAIVRRYKSKVPIDLLRAKTFPIITAAYIYNDCCVEACHSVESGKDEEFGYMTTRGRFVRYDENGKPHLEKDNTISSLLASIQVHLDTPFNPDFSYFDQSSTLSVLPHKNQGFTVWLTGKNTNLVIYV